jgi:D-glucosaminate-6-phosphate ammonia-lyase
MTPTRRTLLRGGGLLGLWPFSKLSAAAKQTPDIYGQLGIRPVINLQGTMTTIGASKVWPEIHEAMAAASSQYVVLDELHDKIAERLSKLIGSEDAMVTTGAAGAIGVGTCACLTGSDTAKIRRLPDLTGMKTEVVVQKAHRTGYDHAVRSTGVRMVEVENRDQFANALNDRTAMIFFLGGTSGDWAWETPVKLNECLEIAKKAGVPLMVDAANMLPPWQNIQRLGSMNIDLICVSGGKHLRGPQCSGILAGRRDLVRAARLNSNPHSDSHGRPMKVGREEMIGLWLACEKYSKLDFEAIDRQSFQQAQYLQKELEKIPGVKTSLAPHDRTRRVHRVLVEWDEAAAGITRQQVERQLIDGEPRISSYRHASGLMFTLFMNEPGDEKIAARRMKEIFAHPRRG